MLKTNPEMYPEIVKNQILDANYSGNAPPDADGKQHYFRGADVSITMFLGYTQSYIYIHDDFLASQQNVKN